MDRVVRSPMWNIITAIFLVGCGTGCALCFVGESISGNLLAGFVELVFVMGAVRALTLGVHATADGLVIREIHRTKKIGWPDVRRARLIRHDAGQGVATPMPELNYTDAEGRERSIRVTALGGRRTAEAERRTDALNDLISRGQSGLAP